MNKERQTIYEIQMKNPQIPAKIRTKLKENLEIKKTEIESALEEKIELHKQKALEKIDEINQTMTRERKKLSDYKAMILEIDTESFSFKNEKDLMRVRKITDELLKKATELNQRSNGAQKRTSYTDFSPNKDNGKEHTEQTARLNNEIEPLRVSRGTNGNKKILIVEDDPVTVKNHQSFPGKGKLFRQYS